MIVFWFTIWIGTVVVFVSWIKMRERIPVYKRDRIEKILMALIIICLIIDILFVVRERRNMTWEANDCIRFFRYYPYHPNATEFYFIRRCDELFDNENWTSILRESGINYHKKYFPSEASSLKDKWKKQMEEINKMDWDKIIVK